MTASVAEIQTQLNEIFSYFNKKYTSVSVDSPSVLSSLETLTQNLELRDIASAGRSIAALRAKEALTPQFCRAIVAPWIQEWGRASNYPNGLSDVEIVRRIIEAQSVTVLERGFTFGSPSGGSWSGSGGQVLYRLTVDEDGQDLEIGLAETISCEVESAIPNTKRFEEVVRLESELAGIAGVEREGSGLVGRIRSTSARQGSNLLPNGSFSSIDDGSDVPSWTMDNTSYAADTSAYYGSSYGYGFDGDAIPQSLSLTASNGGVCDLMEQRIAIDPRRPYLPVIKFLRGSASGTLTLEWGSVSQAVSVTAQSSWTRLVGDRDSDLWPANWMTTAPKFGFDWSGTGTIKIDEAKLIPGVYFRGQWYFLDSGETPPKKGDTLTFADTIGSERINQFWMAYIYGDLVRRVIKPVSGSNNWTEAT